MNKKTREIIYNKYNGKCSYCGCELSSDWQVDHITPIKHFEWGLCNGNPNDLSNLNPACRKCNHYKRCMPLDSFLSCVGFRDYMLSFHKRLAKLPKKTSVKRTKERILYMNDIANRYSITVDNPFSGLFYFEKLEGSSSIQ